MILVTYSSTTDCTTFSVKFSRSVRSRTTFKTPSFHYALKSKTNSLRLFNKKFNLYLSILKLYFKNNVVIVKQYI